MPLRIALFCPNYVVPGLYKRFNWEISDFLTRLPLQPAHVCRWDFSNDGAIALCAIIMSMMC